jgi:nitrite reductase/ring-hydroxylating ferredoxin subunit
VADFVKFISVESLPTGQAKVIELAGKMVAVIHTPDGIFAVDEMCPHRGGPLSEGKIEGNSIVCPWHRARFDFTNGKLLEGPAKRGLACYETKIEEGWIWVRA